MELTVLKSLNLSKLTNPVLHNQKDLGGKWASNDIRQFLDRNPIYFPNICDLSLGPFLLYFGFLFFFFLTGFLFIFVHN
jgi:hypothetical protein